MSLSSKHFDILTAIKTILNAETDLASLNFRVMKKPYNRGRAFEDGGCVSPMKGDEPYHENSIDEIVFRCLASIAFKADGDLTSNMNTELGAIERIADVFRNKSHGNMPATLRAVTTAWATSYAAQAPKIQQTQIRPYDVFIDPAFENNYDVCGIEIRVFVLQRRLDSTGL